MTEVVGVSTFQVETYEADDVIGSIAVRMAELGHPVVIVSGDKDLAQLVNNRIRIYDLAKNVWLDQAGVKAKLGVEPAQIPDLLALLGDSSDNIPGIQGVGEKTAGKLLSVCRTIEDIADANLDSISFRSRENILRRIRENLDTVRMSRELARIRCDIDMEISPATLLYRKGILDQVSSMCLELGFESVMDDIPIRRTEQPGLFD